MILHEIWVLVDVDGLQGQLPEALPAVSVALRGGGHASTPGLPPGAVLEVHGEGAGALPHWSLPVRPSLTSFRKPSSTAQAHGVHS